MLPTSSSLYCQLWLFCIYSFKMNLGWKWITTGSHIRNKMRTKTSDAAYSTLMINKECTWRTVCVVLWLEQPCGLPGAAVTHHLKVIFYWHFLCSLFHWRKYAAPYRAHKQWLTPARNAAAGCLNCRTSLSLSLARACLPADKAVVKSNSRKLHRS